MPPVTTVNGIKYFEVQTPEEIIYSNWFADMNQLLGKLSSSATPMTEADVRSMFDHGTRVFAAIHEGRLVGTVLLVNTHIMAGKKSWIEDVVVDPAYRGQGISSVLMSMAEHVAFAWGAKHVNLTSKPEREVARNGYEKRGYVVRDTGVFRLGPP